MGQKFDAYFLANRAQFADINPHKIMNSATQQGRLFVVSAPSGTGKTTITERLQKMGAAQVSVSHTTRPPRDGESDGENYFFVSRERFVEMCDAELFLEWAEVYGHFYGTSKNWVQQQLKSGGNIILELDVQGARQVKKLLPQAVLIFIRPPSLESLAERLQKRDKDSAEVIARRLSKAEEEIRCCDEYNHVIINDNLEQAVAEVRAIICDNLQNIPQNNTAK